VLRWLETWLHQHIFKVGWLTTKDFQTTTILYYTFFLPGVVLYEIMYWLAAGLLNVRSQSEISWPKPQEIGELKLNFVKVAPRTSPVRVAIIETIPLITGLLLVWYIANNVFELPLVLDTLVPEDTPVTMQSLGAAFAQLVLTPDFWLWFYLAFTVSNTMIPDLSEFRGYRTVGIVVGVVALALVLLGLGSAVVLDFLGGPVATILNTLSSIFTVIIAINVFMVGVLSAIENTIEWITGDSADFRNGKMITMTREERMDRRMREIEKQRQARERRKRDTITDASGPPSIYRKPLPVPGGPGDVHVTPIQRIVEEKQAEDEKKAAPSSERGGASLIPGKLEGDEGRQIPSSGTRPQLAASNQDEEPADDST